MRQLLSPLARSVVLILAAFVIVGLVYQVTGFGLADVFAGVWQGAVTAPGAVASTIRWSIPLLLLGCGVLVSFRAGFFNVGAQGQLYAGAIAALTVSLIWKNGPPLVVIPLGMLAGAAGGAAWSLVPGMLRVLFRTDEVLTTLMMNFIGALLLQYASGGPFKDQTGSGQVTASQTISGTFRLSDSSGVSLVLLAIVAIVVTGTWLLLNRTSFGLQASLAGRNPLMARWQGVNLALLGLVSFALGGALAGLAGSLELFGPSGRVVSGFGPTLGFTAILVALVGELSVLGAVAAAVFFGGLQSAILYLPIVTDLPHSALDLLNGVVALIITVRMAKPTLRRRALAPAPPTPAIRAVPI